MGCCGSKGQYAVEEPGAYEARREKMLEAADRRNAQSAMRGIQNPRSAARLREEEGLNAIEKEGFLGAVEVSLKATGLLVATGSVRFRSE